MPDYGKKRRKTHMDDEYTAGERQKKLFFCTIKNNNKTSCTEIVECKKRRGNDKGKDLEGLYVGCASQ